MALIADNPRFPHDISGKPMLLVPGCRVTIQIKADGSGRISVRDHNGHPMYWPDGETEFFVKRMYDPADWVNMMALLEGLEIGNEDWVETDMVVYTLKRPLPPKSLASRMQQDWRG